MRTGVVGRDELARLAADVDAMVARLDSEERARRDLIAAVSHDLRTPITALRLLADAIDDGLVDAEDRRDYAARIGTHVRALGALIDDLFELTRLESGELTWTMEQVRLDILLHEAVEAMRPAADAEAVTMTAELSPALAAARGNPDKLQRVLFNLIQNAIHHTPPDGSVTVRAERDRRRASRSRSPTPGRESPASTASVCSSRSTAPTAHAPPRAQGSASPSRAPSSRPTAGRSGSRTRPSARACASACRRAARRRRACNAQAPRATERRPPSPGDAP